MQNKKIVYIIAFVLLLLLPLIYFLILRSKGFNILSNNKEVVKNTQEVEDMVNIYQSNMSIFVFATEESKEDHRVHIDFTPYISLSILEGNVKSFKITNFKGSSNAGEVLLISPTSLERSAGGSSFVFTDYNISIKNSGIKSKGNTIEYKVVDEVKRFDEVLNKDYIMPSFGVIVKDIGSVNYESIMERDSIFESNKYLEYLNIDTNRLDTEIQFDIEIQFEDGKKYVKRLKGELDGSLLSDDSYSGIMELSIL